ncbi:MAG: hypothetical protein KDD55_13675, partial [Bdellovibrionales bacterium]|nr:hypothetical protein [Bdellovibrionales bacterium]
DPQPTPSERDEILERLARDLPHAGLDQGSLSYAFAGIRTLFLQSKDGPLSTISRRHQWIWDNQILHLVGGKFTTAALTAEEGFKKLRRSLGWKEPFRSLRGVTYPGAVDRQEQIECFRARCNERNIPEKVQRETIRRLGARVAYFEKDPAAYEQVTPEVLRGELEFIFHIDQCETIEDLLRRRLQLEFYPRGKRAPDTSYFQLFGEYRPDHQSRREDYERRVANLASLCAPGIVESEEEKTVSPSYHS